MSEFDKFLARALQDPRVRRRYRWAMFRERALDLIDPRRWRR